MRNRPRADRVFGSSAARRGCGSSSTTTRCTNRIRSSTRSAASAGASRTGPTPSTWPFAPPGSSAAPGGVAAGPSPRIDRRSGPARRLPAGGALSGGRMGTMNARLDWTKVSAGAALRALGLARDALLHRAGTRGAGVDGDPHPGARDPRARRGVRPRAQALHRRGAGESLAGHRGHQRLEPALHRLPRGAGQLPAGRRLSERAIPDPPSGAG
jgi:hypothetical protein